MAITRHNYRFIMDFEIFKKEIEDKYSVIEFNDGHSKKIGSHANIKKNPFWKIVDTNDKEIILLILQKFKRGIFAKFIFILKN